MSKRTLVGLVALLCITLANASANSYSQQTLTGEWTASSVDDSTKIKLNFKRLTEKGHKRSMGQSFELSDLQGLSREQIQSGGPVSFSLVREAGRIDCQGAFQNGKGSGTFNFTGNPGFVSAMKTRGFDFESDHSEQNSENRLFAATTLNVTTRLADDLLGAGFNNLDTGDLFKAAIFKVDSQFAREMKASGFANLGMEELVKARIFKIDANFVTQMSQMGFNNEPFESLVKFRIFKVSPEFITEVRNEGFTSVTIEEIVKMRIFKIDGEFIRQARAEGVPLEVERLVQRKIGVARHR